MTPGHTLTATTLGDSHPGVLLGNHGPKDNDACLLEHKRKGLSPGAKPSASSLTKKPF